MSVLHIINKPPHHPRSHQLLGQLADEQCLLLIEDAVMSLTDSAWTRALPSGVTVYALEADLKARGLQALAGMDHQAIDYDGFVALTDQATGIIQW